MSHDIFILIGGEYLVGQQRARHRIRIRRSAASHETGNNQIYHVPCPRTTDVNNKVSPKLGTIRLQLANTASAAPRTDINDDEVNKGENKEGTEMQQL